MNQVASDAWSGFLEHLARFGRLTEATDSYQRIALDPERFEEGWVAHFRVDRAAYVAMCAAWPDWHIGGGDASEARRVPQSIEDGVFESLGSQDEPERTYVLRGLDIVPAEAD